MTDESRPAANAAEERARAAMDHLTRVLNDRVTVRTVGELGALLSQLPPTTPLALDEQILADPAVQRYNGEVLVVVASATTVRDDNPTTPIRDEDGEVYPIDVPALQLSLRVVPSPTSPPPADPVPYYLHDRIHAAYVTADTRALFEVTGELMQRLTTDLSSTVDFTVPAPRWHRDLRPLLDRMAQIARDLPAYGPWAAVASGRARMVLVPDDALLRESLYRAKGLVHRIVSNGEVLDGDDTSGQTWDLPPLFTDRDASDALDRVVDALREHLTPHHVRFSDRGTPTGPRLAGTSTERTPVRMVALPQDDVDLVVEAARLCQAALDATPDLPPGSAEHQRRVLNLRELLDAICADHHAHFSPEQQVLRQRDGETPADLVAPLLRLARVLALEEDDDVQTLVRTLVGHGGDVTLTNRAEEAYDRLAGRWASAISPDHADVHRSLY